MHVDAYYTPTAIATLMVKAVSTKPSAIGDLSCGDGHLLAAAALRFGSARVFGVDRNKRVVRALHRVHPEWVLSCADALNLRSIGHTAAARLAAGSCLLMNPPFSMGKKKGVLFRSGLFEGRCSVAMAHLLRSVELASPQQIVAILPESVLFSQLDAQALAYVCKLYRLQPLATFGNNSFSGARVTTRMVRFTARRRVRMKTPLSQSCPTVELVRGSLPIHRIQTGLFPFVHTTDLRRVASDHRGWTKTCTRVAKYGNGLVRGKVILVPRVGRISGDSPPTIVRFEADVQLSDCVIAIRGATDGETARLHRLMAGAWKSSAPMWGTGAKYTTLAAIRNWLAELLRVKQPSMGDK